MPYKIEYTVLCHKGLVRTKNQDNFWCENHYLASENNGLDKPLSGVLEGISKPSFCVFDGMGGEKHGEIAAYIAASTFDTLHREKSSQNINSFLLNACLDMNKEVCRYQADNNISHMGTTAVIFLFFGDYYYICNIGDSRAYKFNNGNLVQLSVDHVTPAIAGRKAPLSQSLGIPETEFIIEPYILKDVIKNGDRFLLCSDGLTDMLSDEEISNIFKKKECIKDVSQILLTQALERGGVDNTTIVVCRVKRYNRFFHRFQRNKDR